LQRLGWQVALGLLLLAAWQFLPRVGFLAENFKFLNSFYISSPVDVAESVADLLTGSGAAGLSVWPYLRTTLFATIVGAVLGLALGALFGLIFSNAQRLSDVVRPYIVLANSVPRIALIPIFIVIVGPDEKASILSVVAVVFFLGFFNAFEGGRSLRQSMLDNAKLLGARPISVMRTIRLPMVLTWTFAAVPNAISFGLVVAVTTELLTGVQGMGTLLQNALTSINATLTFAVIVILSFVGLLLSILANALRSYVMRWQA
jgi:NitT/TauT family transport system permease protein